MRATNEADETSKPTRTFHFYLRQTYVLWGTYNSWPNTHLLQVNKIKRVTCFGKITCFAKNGLNNWLTNLTVKIIRIIIHQIFLLARNWSKRITWLNKTGEYPRIFPTFQNCTHCEKDLKDNKDNSLHLGRKYARIFVLGHYLLLQAHSLCSRKTVRFSEQIMSTDKYPSIFSRQMAAIVYL